jgi:hypothetical protein
MVISDKEIEVQIVREALAAGYRDLEWLWAHPDISRDYAGEWIVILDGQIIAHGSDGAVVAGEANINRFPGSSLHYIPSEEEREAIRII